jgi:hypothetical protein|tara:strand:+ start:1012 stop:1599 length:588 start_codon:yes stop_codon:yes gene_type:complete
MNKLTTVLLTLLSSIFGFSQTVDNYLQTEKTLLFNNTNYDLVWSSHPTETYYKQEYLPSEQGLEDFRSMVIIEFIKGDISVDDAVAIKIKELDTAKESNPIVNYTVFKREGEVIIDFLLSANSEDGMELLVVERNIYRNVATKTNQTNGLLLFAVSERAYENEIDAFFANLKKNKNSLIEKVGNFDIPKIKLNLE